MNESSGSHLRGVVFAAAGYLLFSAGDAVAKYMRQFDYSSSQISFQYATTAVLALLIFSEALGGIAATLRTQHKWLHLLRGLVSAPTQAFNFYAFSKMPMANVYAVIFLAPFLTAALAAIFLKEQVRLIHWAIIGLGFTGVLIAMRPNVYGFSLPVAAVLVTAMFTSIRNVTVRLLGADETPLSLALFPAAAIVLATSGPALATGKLPEWPDAMILSTGGLLYAGGLLLTCLAFRYAPAAVAGPFHYTQILWAMAAGVLLFDDLPDYWTIVGSLIIVATGVSLVRLQTRHNLSEDRLKNG